MTKGLLDQHEAHRAFANGSSTPIDGTGDAVLLRICEYGDERLLIAIDTSGHPATVH